MQYVYQMEVLVKFKYAVLAENEAEAREVITTMQAKDAYKHEVVAVNVASAEQLKGLEEDCNGI